MIQAPKGAYAPNFRQLQGAAGKLYYTSYANRLYVLDRKKRRGVLVFGPKKERPFAAGHTASFLTAGASGLFFESDYRYDTSALWFTDGTDAGTKKSPISGTGCIASSATAAAW